MCQAGFHFGLALLGAVPQANDPFGTILGVVGAFFDGFSGNLAQALIGTARQGLQLEKVEGVKVKLTRQGVAPVAIRLFDQQVVFKRSAITEIRQVVFRATLPDELGGILVVLTRQANEVQRNVG